MTTAYINRIATGVPPHDVHPAFLRYARALFENDERLATLLQRMAERSGIEHRYSYLAPTADCHVRDVGSAMDTDAFYIHG